MDEESAKRALIEARWDKGNRRRESVRAVIGLGIVLVAVFIGIWVIQLIGSA